LALSQSALAIVYHATRRVTQNQPEQVFETPHVVEESRTLRLSSSTRQPARWVLVPLEPSRRDDGNGDCGLG